MYRPKSSLIYLASPYWHDDPKVREERVKTNAIYCGDALLDGKRIYSPLVHFSGILRYHDVPCMTEDKWLEFAMSIMLVCSELYVLKLDGWDKSFGVGCEISMWKWSKRSKIVYIEP